MNKGKSITLLSIISVIVAFVLVMTFIRFPVGIKNYNSLLGAIELDYDLGGGTAYTLTLAQDNEDEVTNIDDVVDTLSYRLDALGYGVYIVKAVKSMDEGVEDYQIRIETKTTDTLAADMAVVTAFGELKFFGGTEENPTTEILQDVNVVKSAKYKGEVTTGSHEIDIEFTKEAFNELKKNIDAGTYYLKITLGENEAGEENVLFTDEITMDYFQNIKEANKLILDFLLYLQTEHAEKIEPKNFFTRSTLRFVFLSLRAFVVPVGKITNALKKAHTSQA